MPILNSPMLVELEQKTFVLDRLESKIGDIDGPRCSAIIDSHGHRRHAFVGIKHAVLFSTMGYRQFLLVLDEWPLAHGPRHGTKNNRIGNGATPLHHGIHLN